MGKFGHSLTMTRRSFNKLMAVCAAAATATGIAEPRGLAEAATPSPATISEGNDVVRIRTCCRGCGKMECGVWVTVQNGRAIKVEGDQSAFQSSGNCCTKSQSSLQAAYHPDRIYHPMKRTKPKGEDPGWVRISWDEAYDAIGRKFNEIMDKYEGKAIFNMCGTSRQWVYGPYAFYKWLFNTPNAHVASQICKGPRRLMGWMNSFDGAPWMALNDGPRVYLQWGTAPENSNYDDSCRNLVDKMSSAECHICVDPRLSGSGKEADYWLNLRPGSDGALALCWEKLIIDNDLVDWEFVKRWTNAPILVVEDREPTGGRYYDLTTSLAPDVPADICGSKLKTRLLKECDIVEGGSVRRFMAWNKNANEGKGGLVYWDTDTTQWEGCNHVAPKRSEMDVVYRGTWQEGYLPKISYQELVDADIDFDMEGTHEVRLADGTLHKAKPVWKYLLESLEGCSAQWCSNITGLDPALITEACLKWATRPAGQGYGNGGVHVQLAPDQIGNCSQTVRTLIHLMFLTGNLDGPAGNRGLTRTPVDEQYSGVPGNNMPAHVKAQLMGLGVIPGGKEDPLNLPDHFDVYSDMVGADEFPLTAYYNEWADATRIWEAVQSSKPYPLKGGINQSGSFMNQSNSALAWESMRQLEFWVDINMFHHPGTEMADILLPCLHWSEINNVRVSQGASGGIGATVRAIEPPADARFDYDINVGIFKAVGGPNATWTTLDGKTEYPEDTIVRLDAGFAASNSPWKSWDEYNSYFQKNGWINAKEVEPDRWGTYRRFETGWMRIGKDACGGSPFSADLNANFGFPTPSALAEFWPLIWETFALDKANESSPGKFDVVREMMPRFDEPASGPQGDADTDKYPFILTTGRRIPVYFHSEHRQLPWCRELWPVPRCELNPRDAERLGVAQGDWVWIETEWGKIRQCVDLYHGIAPGWANAEHAWWFPELPAPTHGFELCNVEQIWNPRGQDPFIGSSHMRGVPVNIYKATRENCPNGQVVPCAPEDGTQIICDSSDPRLKEWLPDYDIRKEI
ncbi:MAG: molybdopterin-dependent oxidoreductase [Coriobacteriaceae bacterium]|jgi:anaerobic selenocysteine-containing dehydrogenase|nr:molybdopterin-dependent oxidoreductase [Coriobacteriaceae bacterium]